RATQARRPNAPIAARAALLLSPASGVSTPGPAQRYGIGLLFLALTGCVEPYLPEVVDAKTNYLVVDGFINGNGVTRIKLSRTNTVSVATAPPAEKGAKVFIIDNTGVRYALKENASGSYQSDSLLLAPTRQYQLRISPATGSAVYESSLVPLKVTPPIDDLKWRLDNDRVQLLISTHDASQQSRYYRWGFAETWEFHSGIRSYLEYEPVYQYLAARTTNIYTCWRTEYPSSIRQGSSAQLNQDALVDFPYMAIPVRAERLSIRYSVLNTLRPIPPAELYWLRQTPIGGRHPLYPLLLLQKAHWVPRPSAQTAGYGALM
nr:hypothetical protein [Tanacetum cinerariifolium]